MEVKTHYAKAICRACNQEIESTGGGMFMSCKCGKSFIDQERFDGRYVRLGGDAELLEQKCPPHCKIEDHSVNNEKQL